MPRFHRAVHILLFATVWISVDPSMAAQANRTTLRNVSQLIIKAHDLLSEGNDTKAARTECEKALAIDNKVDDPFVTATVHICFGDVEDYSGNQSEACRQYDSALKSFEAVPARHSARRTLDTYIKVTKGKRLQLGC